MDRQRILLALCTASCHKAGQPGGQTSILRIGRICPATDKFVQIRELNSAAMNNQPPMISHQTDDVEIGLLDLIQTLWKKRWIVVGIMIACIAVAIFYLNIATYKYTAELKVTPSQLSGAGSSNAGGLAGLASLAGVHLSKDSTATPFELFMEGLKSGLAAESLVHDRDIMKVAFQAEWSESKGGFVERKSLPGNIIRAVKRGLGLPVYPWKEPNAIRLQNYIQENVKITESPKSPVVTISFSHKDPVFAKKFLTVLHESLDNQLREKALIRSTKYISYLTNQLQKVTVAEHRAALADALSEQEKFRMTASSGLAYAADPFGTVTVSLNPTSPRPAIVIILSVILGLVLGSLIALAASWMRKEIALP